MTIKNGSKAFRKEIERQWGEYVGSTNKTWVEYGDGARSRSIVDFKKGVVTIQVLAVKSGAVLPAVKKQLEDAVVRAIDSRGSSQTVPPSPSGRDEGVLSEPVLTNQIAGPDGTIVTPQNAADFAQHVADAAATQKSAAGDERFEKYTFSFPLVPDHLARRMAPFVTVVKKYCLEFDLNFAQVLALIHTESYFNPLARSASNAIGLMQLVPEQGGREAYRFVSNDAAAEVPPVSSLFDPETNIHLGCAYLYLLRTRDFGDVTNRECGMYCSIAGYNGGPACVAYAFTGDNKLPPAIRTINSMNDPDRVYLFLVRNLPAAETRQYLESVRFQDTVV